MDNPARADYRLLPHRHSADSGVYAKLLIREVIKTDW
jgi:hypothetical protein